MSTRRKIIVLLFFLAICTGATVANFFLNLHRMDDVAPSDLYRVIHSQLEAFRAEDFSRAYSQASYSMRQKFSRAEFEKMVRTDYADITQAERIEFGTVKCRDRRALIQVFFISHDGSVLPCIYNLIYEQDHWKIDGAVMLPRWPTGSRFEGIRV